MLIKAFAGTLFTLILLSSCTPTTTQNVTFTVEASSTSTQTQTTAPSPTATATPMPTALPVEKPQASLLSLPVVDNFDDGVVNTCLWYPKEPGYIGDGILADTIIRENGRLQLIPDPHFSDTIESIASVCTQYGFTGDFDVQFDVQMPPEWGQGIPSSQEFDVRFKLNVWAGYPYVISLIRYKNPTGDYLLVESFLNGVKRVPTSFTDGTWRIIRKGNRFEFLIRKRDGDWIPFYSSYVSEPRLLNTVYLCLSAEQWNTNKEETVYIDNFTINSGDTNYKQFLWPSEFKPRSDLLVGGTIYDYIWGQDWYGSGYWGDINPIEHLANNGMNTIRAGLTTLSYDEFKTDPPWKKPGGDELTYIHSLEWTERIFKDSNKYGISHLVMAFYFSDQLADGGRQNAPPEWQNLSLEQSIEAVYQHTKGMTQYFKERGYNIEYYEIGNEMGGGIMNFRLGERIPWPDNYWRGSRLDWMQKYVWSQNALLIKSAIKGIKVVDPDAKIILHPGQIDRFDFNTTSEFTRYMIEQDVDFDYLGLSVLYPSRQTNWMQWLYSSTCYFQYLQSIIDEIASLGKKTMILEVGYPAESIPVNIGLPLAGYSFTPEGQAALVRDFLLFSSHNENIVGFFYWSPDNTLQFRCETCSWNGLFSTVTEPLPSLYEFRVTETDK
jgi:arabinogalactan endo-1,4-beta-galactosidase